MDIEKEIEAIKKRVDMLEIRATEGDIKESKTEILLERLLEVARIQAGHSESMNKSFEAFRQEVGKRFESVEQQIANLVDYLKNPPKNGH